MPNFAFQAVAVKQRMKKERGQVLIYQLGYPPASRAGGQGARFPTLIIFYEIGILPF
jgi:hypothetical protein